MFLMDSIIQTNIKVRNSGLTHHPTLEIFPYLESALQGCPRFLFNEDAIHTAVELTLGRPKVLREAMQHLTIPYPRMWIEWPESGREKLRQTFSIDAYEHPGRPLPKRLGFLIESDGRKGIVIWAWNNNMMKDDEAPNVCPISPYFDLDGDFKEKSRSRDISFLSANLAHIWRDNKIQLDALLSIWDTSIHGPSVWGKKFLDYGYRNQDVANFYADVYGEYIMIWSTLMLLTSSRKIVNYEKIDNTKWNKARAKQGKPPMMDHTVVTIHIGGDAKAHQKGAPLGFNRKSPRVHMVSSYLNRRGDKHWIVQPFWRGTGEKISRYVRVKK
jgi:hypothetical protein